MTHSPDASVLGGRLTDAGGRGPLGKQKGEKLSKCRPRLRTTPCAFQSPVLISFCYSLGQVVLFNTPQSHLSLGGHHKLVVGVESSGGSPGHLPRWHPFFRLPHSG